MRELYHHPWPFPAAISKPTERKASLPSFSEERPGDPQEAQQVEMNYAPQEMQPPSVVQGMGWVGVRVEVQKQKGCRARYLSVIL